MPEVAIDYLSKLFESLPGLTLGTIQTLLAFAFARHLFRIAMKSTSISKFFAFSALPILTTPVVVLAFCMAIWMLAVLVIKVFGQFDFGVQLIGVFYVMTNLSIFPILAAFSLLIFGITGLIGTVISISLPRAVYAALRHRTFLSRRSVMALGTALTLYGSERVGTWIKSLLPIIGS